MNMQNGQTTKRRNTAWKTGLLTLGLSAGALGLAWMLWGTSASQPDPFDRQNTPNDPSPSSLASAHSVFAAGGASSVSQASPNPSPAGTASTSMAPPKAPMTHLKPSSPEIDLATQAHLALQSGTADEAEKAASAITICEIIERQVKFFYESPLKDSAMQTRVVTSLSEDQRRCQALDAAAKALYEPLLLKAFEGGSRSAARSISTQSELLAKLTPEQRLRVAQSVKERAAQGDLTAIQILSNASARLGTSVRDDYTYALAFQSIRRAEGKDLKYFGAFPKEHFEFWDAQLKLKEQQLSQAELEQARQQSDALLRSYREARLKEPKWATAQHY